MFHVETDDYGHEVWFGGSGDGTITIEGKETTWYAGGMRKDTKRWSEAIKEAHLIAAAPDMLEALCVIVDAWYDSGIDAIGNPLSMPEEIKNAVSIIAKAKG